MAKAHALAVVLFGCMQIGADGGGCDPWAGWAKSPSPSATSSTNPFCYTDPPQGCAAYCLDVDMEDFTPQCANVEAGPREAAFQTLAQDKFDNLLVQGVHVCNGTNSGDGITSGVRVTPCQLNIPPVEWPGQDHEVCTPPPPGCQW